MTDASAAADEAGRILKKRGCGDIRALNTVYIKITSVGKSTLYTGYADRV